MKNVTSRRLASKLQRTLLAVVLFFALFNTLPVDIAHAQGYFDGVVKCSQGFYSYSFDVSGDYPNQWVAFRFLEYRVNANGTETLVKTVPASGHYLVQATGPAGDYLYMTTAKVINLNYATKGTFVRVRTEAWFWDNVAQKYNGPFYDIASHYPYFGSGPLTACQIW